MEVRVRVCRENDASPRGRGGLLRGLITLVLRFFREGILTLVRGGRGSAIRRQDDATTDFEFGLNVGGRSSVKIHEGLVKLVIVQPTIMIQIILG